MGKRLSIPRHACFGLETSASPICALDSRKTFPRTKNEHYAANQFADSRCCRSPRELVPLEKGKETTRRGRNRKNPEGSEKTRPSKTGPLYRDDNNHLMISNDVWTHGGEGAEGRPVEAWRGCSPRR
ncbi:hypothetical protein HN011_008224 [Eciton burchellii]|nr:hypothetical protein HN011_008224 [Eciton burchellii]